MKEDLIAILWNSRRIDEMPRKEVVIDPKDLVYTVNGVKRELDVEWIENGTNFVITLKE